MRVTQMPAGGSTGDVHRSMNTPIMPKAHESHSTIDIKKILSRFEKDDYILAGLILVLMLEGCDDYILLAALGYLFFMGLRD